MAAKSAQEILPRVLMTAALAFFLASTGCNREPQRPTAATDTKAFDSASAEVKANWATVIAASATNGYFTAITTLRKLQTTPDLTDDQRNAVAQTMGALNDRLMDAAQKGDPDAQKALQDIRANWRQ